MTVQELIEKLQAIEDKSIIVVTSGFDENGIDPLANPEEIEIYSVAKDGVYGPTYNLVSSWTDLNGKQIIKACYVNFM